MMKLGEKIKNRRKEIQMTQTELSDGICTQAMISRIEKKKVRPSRELMEKIAERLDVSLHYFYGEDSIESRYSKTAQLRRMIRQHLERNEYDSVSYLIESNEALIQHAVGEDKDFFQWMTCLLYAYRDGDNGKALKCLTSMEKGVTNGELRIEILNSIGKQYFKKEDYIKAEEYYRKGKDAFAEWMDHEKKAELLLDYAICLFNQQKFTGCLDNIFEGLDLIIEKKTLFLLGDFLFLKGNCLNKLNQMAEASDAYRQAYTIFEIQQNEKYTVLSKMAIEQTEEKKLKKTTGK